MRPKKKVNYRKYRRCRCFHCCSDRQHHNRKKILSAEEKMKEYIYGGDMIV